MRRRLPAFLLALLLFVCAVAAGAWVSRRLAPEQVRASAREALAAALGSPVEVVSARLRLAGGGPLATLEARGVSAYAGSGSPHLRVEHVAARVDLLPLLMGRVELRQVTLEGAVLRLHRDGAGRLGPPALVDRLLGAHPDAQAGGLSAGALLRRGAEAARALLRSPLPFLRRGPREITLHGARLVLDDRRAGARVALGGLEGVLARGARGRPPRLRLSGSLGGPAGPAGWVVVEAWRPQGADGTGGGSPGTELAVEARNVDLAVLAPWAAELHPDLAVGGVARGTARVRLGGGADGPAGRSLELDLLVAGPRLALPRGSGAPLRLAGEAAAATARLEITPRRVRLASAELDWDGQRTRLAGVLERPLRADARAHLEVGLRALRVERARELAALLPDALQRAVAQPLARVERGHLESLDVRGDGALADWARALEPDTAPLPVEIEARAAFSDVSVALGGEGRWEGLAGRLAVDRRGVRLRSDRATRELPRLDLEIAGLERLLTEGRRAPAPAPPLPGLRALGRALQARLAPGTSGGERGEGDGGEPDGAPPEVEPPPFARAHLAFGWLAHPALGYPLEDLELAVETAPGGRLDLEARGRWGGLPVTARGHLEPGRLVLRARVDADAAVAAPRLPASPDDGLWATGTVRVESVRWSSAGLRLARVEAGLVGRGPLLSLHELVATTPGGARAHGRARLGLGGGSAGAAWVELDAGLDDAALGALGTAAGLAPEDLAGALDARIRLVAALEPGVPLRERLAGRIDVEVRDAVLHRRPALSGSIAASGAEFADLGRADRPLRFDAVRARLELDAGQVASDDLVLENERVRIVASGRAGLAPPHPLEGVIAFFPRNAVDAVMDHVPLIGPVLQGPDGRLIGRYLEVTGPWAAPEVAAVEQRGLARGMLEEVPDFVMTGIRAIAGVLGRLNPMPGGGGDGPAEAPRKEGS